MSEQLVGAKIKTVRPMTKRELSELGWEQLGHGAIGIAIVLDNGVVLYPSRDPEGNGPGVVFGKDKSGDFVLG